MRKFRTVVALISLCLAITACGSAGSTASNQLAGDWNSIVAAAKKEGAVTIYSSQNPDRLDAIKKAFQAQYPEITVTVVRSSDSDITTKAATENQSGKGVGDVLVSASEGFAAQADNLVARLRGPDFDARAYDRNASVRDDTYFLEGGVVYGLGWNTDALPTGLSDATDLLNPGLKGKIGIPQAVDANYVAFYHFLDQTYGEDFAQRLAALKPRIYPGTINIAEALASGEIDAGLAIAPPTEATAAGAPVGFKLPRQPYGIRLTGMALKAGPHPNAAQLLANFMVTEKGQKAAAGDSYVAALPHINDLGVARDLPPADLDTLTPAFVSDYANKWSQLFQ